MFLNNEFTDEYYYLINFVKLQNRKKKNGEYFEWHHVIPVSLNGNNKIENKVLLTPDEHFHCHVLLTKMTEGDACIKMNYALLCLRRKWKNEYKNVDFDEYSEYTYAKRIVSENTTKRQTGRKHTLETIEKMKGKKSKEHCENISKGLKGRIPWNKGKFGVSVETSEKLASTAKKTWTGRKHGKETIEKMKNTHRKNRGFERP